MSAKISAKTRKQESHFTSKNKAKSLKMIEIIVMKLDSKIKNHILQQAFGILTIQVQKRASKFQIINTIINMKIQDAFLQVLSFQKSQNKLDLTQITRFSLILMHQALCGIQNKRLSLSLTKMRQFARGKCIKNKQQAVKIVSKTQNRFCYRIVGTLFLKKLKEKHFKDKQQSLCFRRLSFCVNKIQKKQLKDSFEQIILFAMTKYIQRSNDAKKQKINVEKTIILAQNQQRKTLRNTIPELDKDLQRLQSKLAKQKNQRGLILKAKTVQEQKNKSQLKKLQSEKGVRQFEAQRKRNYLERRLANQDYNKGSISVVKKLHTFFISESSKESYSLKALGIVLLRNEINLTDGLKKFSDSKDFYLQENVNLKNFINLYEKQIPGFGSNVHIAASQTYKQTFDQNQNLRELMTAVYHLFIDLQKDRRQISSLDKQITQIVEIHKS